MSDRPEPAVRCAPRKRPGKDDRLRGQHEFISQDFYQHEEGLFCPYCNNVRMRGVVNVFGSFANRRMVRAILVVVVLVLGVSVYIASIVRGMDRRTAIEHHDRFPEGN